jgi:hypothetical protein
MNATRLCLCAWLKAYDAAVERVDIRSRKRDWMARGPSACSQGCGQAMCKNPGWLSLVGLAQALLWHCGMICYEGVIDVKTDRIWRMMSPRVVRKTFCAL